MSQGATPAWKYGLLGLPLAFVALPLYVHLPHVYASSYGVPLATLGLVFLLARLFDAVTDPWLGRVSDRLHLKGPPWVLGAGALAALGLVLGMVLLFYPPWPQAGEPFLLLLTLIVTGLAFSLLSISHQAWGARLGGSEVQRTGLVAWREGAGLVGVVMASVLPTWLDWGAWISVFAISLAAGLWMWARSRVPAMSTAASGSAPPLAASPAAPAMPAMPAAQEWIHPWKSRSFRRLMAVFIISGMASAVPATLVLFFIRDVLRTPELEPLFLSTYFVAAALSMPLWMKGVARWGLARSWLAGMLISVLVFVWASQLSQGDALGYGLVCALSGLAVGADLAFPAAMLAGIIKERGDRGRREGAYFGWWNFATKLNLALAAGVALPLLEWMGYQAGTSSESGLQALSLAYAVIPCALKLVAALALYVAFIRPSPPHTSPVAEAL